MFTFKRNQTYKQMNTYQYERSRYSDDGMSNEKYVCC